MADEMRGKTVLVTGATGGIGLVTARELASMGATVVVVGRTQAKGEAAAREIQAATGSASIAALAADLTSQAQVRRLAEDVRARYPRLDVLINNAGAAFTSRQLTVDGIEATFALNHLAPFLLTNLLLDTLKASAPSRVITVASQAHAGQSLDFTDLQYEKRPYKTFQVYGASKLANVLFTYGLARRLDGSGVTANCLHPGFVASRFGMNNGGLWIPIFTMLRPFQISVERGAETSVYLASSPGVASVSGDYFDKKKPVASSPQSYDEAAQRRLWELSEQLTGLAMR
ncbi:MAG TPA: SDR family oxidoreductase [Ktedonobacterales bacterium]